MLETTLPKRHVTRGIPSIASDEFAAPKVSCIVKYTFPISSEYLPVMQINVYMYVIHL